jgi:hypothetical protein
MLHLCSTLVLLLIVSGIAVRKKPALHLRFMVAAFIADFVLVLYIEATRHAVETVIHQTKGLLWFHAAISTLVLAGYVGQIILGRRMLGGVLTSRRTHIITGISFCALRVANYVTSFMVS